MKEKFFNEIVLSVFLIVLTALFLDPFMLWMPTKMIYMLITGLIAVFAIFAGLVWREKARDERDEFHKMLAGRIGYLLGLGVLIVGIIWQTIASHPDAWLVAALVGMVIGRLYGLYYGQTKK